VVVYVKTKTRIQKNVVLANYTPKDIKNVTNQILRSYIIMNTSQKIFKKLFKDEKTELKTQKVKIALNKVEKLQEQIGIAYSSFESFEERFDEVQDARMKAKDVIVFDFDDARTQAEELIQDIQKAIDDLGIDTPDELEQAESDVKELENMYNKAKSDLKSIGWSI